MGQIQVTYTFDTTTGGSYHHRCLGNCLRTTRNLLKNLTWVSLTCGIKRKAMLMHRGSSHQAVRRI